MDKKTTKQGTGYLSQVIKELTDLIDQVADRADLKAKLTKYMADRILESYKNGIAAGRKQNGRA